MNPSIQSSSVLSVVSKPILRTAGLQLVLHTETLRTLPNVQIHDD